MGLDDPKLKALHKQVQEAIYWSPRPDWQKVCEILNGMEMRDMLDEIWRIKGTGWLDSLALNVPSRTGVNNSRLRVAIGALQDQPPGDFDALLRLLPADQQRAIKSVRAVTQAPDPLTPSLWSKFYWSTRSLAPPGADGGNGSQSGTSTGAGDNDAAHLAADIATALTANAPKGSNPTTYTVTVVFRNLDALKLGKGNTEVALLHEPNVSVQISPDPNSPAAYQAAISLINVHLKRNWGLLKPDVEISVGAQAGVAGGSPNAGLQAQVEVHVTTQISIVASSGLNFGPGVKPGDPPDRGAIHFGNRDVDASFTPFMIGIVGHWDPP